VRLIYTSGSFYQGKRHGYIIAEFASQRATLFGGGRRRGGDP